MKDNRGLTLVELLITVTILALVIAGAATFMLAGSRSFAKGSADSNVQGEAELVVNQIEDLIIDVNGGVDFTDNTAASTLTMYHVEADSIGVAVNKKRTVKLNKSDKKLYYSECTVTKDDVTGAYKDADPTDPTTYSDQLLAENVTDFNVDLSDKYTETAKDGTDIEIVRSVVITVGCLDGTGKSTYATTPTITLRNRLMISSSPDEVFDKTPAPDDSLLLYISSTGMEGALPIRDRVTTVERGKVYNIFAMVSVGTNVNSLCNFTVEGEASGHLSTITPDGVHIALDVDESEPNNYLKITATYKNNSAKTVSGWVKVIGGKGKSLDDVKIFALSLEPFNPRYGSTVSYTDLTDDDIEGLEYTWSVSKPDKVESFVNTNKTLELNIIKAKENYNRIFTITLEVYCPATNQRKSDSVDYRIDSEGTISGDAQLERGKADGDGQAHGHVWNSFEKPPFWPKNMTYDYYFCDIYGERVPEVDDALRQYALVSVGYWYYTLTFTRALPPESEYYIKIIITCEDWEDSEPWVYERVQYIPAVSLHGITSKGPASETWTRRFDLWYDLVGYYENAWVDPNDVVEYEVVDLVYDAPEGVTVTANCTGTYNAHNEDWGGELIDEFRIHAQFAFECSDWSRTSEVSVKKLKVKVSMKGHPGIYCYSTLILE